MKKSNYLQRNKGRITHSKLMSFKYCPMLYKLKYLDEKVEETESDALTF